MENIQDEFYGKWLALAHLKLFHLLTRIIQKEGFDLTFEQFIMLKVINTNEGITQQKLAGIMSKDKTSIARAISVLEDHHKVVRISLKDDKRKKGLYLTKQGKEQLALAIPKFTEIRNELEMNFSEQEISQTINTLKKIIDRANQLEEQL